MFRIVAHPTFTCQVRLSVPGSDQPQLIGITFRHKGARELGTWLASAGTRQTDAEFLHDVIADWAGVVDGEDRPVPFNRENLARLLDVFPASGSELVIAYRRQLQDARAKN